jgi:hypothetical protein
MTDSTGPAGLVPALVATAAVLIAAIALTVAGAATPIVVVVWIGAALVGASTLALVRRR